MADYKYVLGSFEVTEAMKTDFDENGFVIVRNLFGSNEVEKIKTAIFDNGMIKHTYKIPDADGRAPHMALWQHPGTDITGMVGRCEKVVTTAEKLLGVEELYHYHGKFILKHPNVGGKFEWHQDYGYWYRYCLKPDMMAVFIAVDECTRENGGLQLLSGSHKYGRVNHGFHGGQQGADLERVGHLMKRCPLVYGDCQPGIWLHESGVLGASPDGFVQGDFVGEVHLQHPNQPVAGPDILEVKCPFSAKDTTVKEACLTKKDFFLGDAIFFHSNVLHCSGPNNSGKRRLAINISFCERSNEPVVKNISPQYSKIDKVPDSAVINCSNLSDFTGKNFVRQEDDELVKIS